MAQLAILLAIFHLEDFRPEFAVAAVRQARVACMGRKALLFPVENVFRSEEVDYSRGFLARSHEVSKADACKRRAGTITQQDCRQLLRMLGQPQVLIELHDSIAGQTQKCCGCAELFSHPAVLEVLNDILLEKNLQAPSHAHVDHEAYQLRPHDHIGRPLRTASLGVEVFNQHAEQHHTRADAVQHHKQGDACAKADSRKPDHRVDQKNQQLQLVKWADGRCQHGRRNEHHSHVEHIQRAWSENLWHQKRQGSHGSQCHCAPCERRTHPPWSIAHDVELNGCHDKGHRQRQRI
mmetsp:Transcript_22771/g.53622  ORF Transcript_22771/g.53622 Transcript_22771/m.53622 type:complete len:293 (-) Transcript_22771:293-1171(-)